MKIFENDYGKKKYWVGCFLLPIILVIVIWLTLKVYLNPVSILGSISSYLGIFITLYTLYRVDDLEKSLIEKKKDNELDEIYKDVLNVRNEHFKSISSTPDSLRGKDFSKLIMDVSDIILKVKKLNNYSGIDIEIKEGFSNFEESLSESDIVPCYKTLKNDYEDLILNIYKKIKERRGEC